MIFNVGRGNDNNALDADLPSVNACGVWSENCLLEVLVQQQLKKKIDKNEHSYK